MVMAFSESIVEQAALAWLETLGYTILSGPDIAPGELQAERDEYRQVVLERRSSAGASTPQSANADRCARRCVPETDPPGLPIVGRQQPHRPPISRRGRTGRVRAVRHFAGWRLRACSDYDNPANNDFVAVHQFTIVEDHHERRPDIVLFVNGLPLAVIELKNAVGERDIWSAFNQLQTYKQQIPRCSRSTRLL